MKEVIIVKSQNNEFNKMNNNYIITIAELIKFRVIIFRKDFSI